MLKRTTWTFLNGDRIKINPIQVDKQRNECDKVTLKAISYETFISADLGCSSVLKIEKIFD